MRHLILLVVLLLAGYGLWLLAGRATLHRLARHGLRIAAGLAVLLAGLVLAYHFNAFKLL
jgi:hypothetical protein